MKHKTISMLLGGGVVVVSVIANVAHADKALDVLKSISQGVKALREKANQDSSQQLPSSNDGAVEDVGIGSDVATNRSSYDVSGIKIGMSVMEVKKALSGRPSSSSSFPVNFDSYGQKWIGMYASLPAEVVKIDNRFNKKSDDVVIADFSNPPLKQKVLAVTKYKSYSKDKTPSLAATEASLIEKYGWWDLAKTDRGANFYFWGRNARTGATCITVKLADPVYRLGDLIRAESTTSVICQGYGKWGQCIKPARDYIDFNKPLKGCGVQASAYVRYANQGSKETSPVSEIGTFVADFDGISDSEDAFSEMAQKYEKNKNQSAIKKGGRPDL